MSCGGSHSGNANAAVISDSTKAVNATIEAAISNLPDYSAHGDEVKTAAAAVAKARARLDQFEEFAQGSDAGGRATRRAQFTEAVRVREQALKDALAAEVGASRLTTFTPDYRSPVTVTEAQAEQLRSYPYVDDVIAASDGNVLAIVPMEESSQFSPRDMENTALIDGGRRSRYLPNEAGLDNENYDLAESIENIKEEHGPNTYIAPIYVYDHGGVAMSIGTPPSADKWDTSMAGFVIIPESRVQEQFGDTSPESWEQARKNAEIELDSYSKWVNGDMWGLVTIDKNGNEVDSVWGFYGADDAKDASGDYL